MKGNQSKIVSIALALSFSATSCVASSVDPFNMDEWTINPDGNIEMGPPSVVEPSNEVKELQEKIRQRELELQRIKFKQYEV